MRSPSKPTVGGLKWKTGVKKELCELSTSDEATLGDSDTESWKTMVPEIRVENSRTIRLSWTCGEERNVGRRW